MGVLEKETTHLNPLNAGPDTQKKPPNKFRMSAVRFRSSVRASIRSSVIRSEPSEKAPSSHQNLPDELVFNLNRICMSMHVAAVMRDLSVAAILYAAFTILYLSVIFLQVGVQPQNEMQRAFQQAVLAPSFDPLGHLTVDDVSSIADTYSWLENVMVPNLWEEEVDGTGVFYRGWNQLSRIHFKTERKETAECGQGHGINSWVCKSLRESSEEFGEPANGPEAFANCTGPKLFSVKRSKAGDVRPSSEFVVVFRLPTPYEADATKALDDRQLEQDRATVYSGTTSKEMIAAIHDLKRRRWLDHDTTVFEVMLESFNRNLGVFLGANIKFAFSQSGSVYAMAERIDLNRAGASSLSTSVLQVKRYYFYTTSLDKFRAFLELLLLFANILYAAHEVRRMLKCKKEQGGYVYYWIGVGRYWNVITFLSVFMFFINTFVYIAMVASLGNGDAHQKSYDTYIISKHVGIYQAVNALLMAFLLLRGMKFLKLEPRLEFVQRTLSKGGQDLVLFLSFFLTVLAVYAIVGYYSFGPTVDEFVTVAKSFETLFEVLTLGLPKEVITSRPDVTMGFVPTVYYWSFIIISFFLLLNVFIAIISSAYDDIRNETVIIRQRAEAFLRGPLHGRVPLGYWARITGSAILRGMLLKWVYSFPSERQILRILSEQGIIERVYLRLKQSEDGITGISYQDALSQEKQRLAVLSELEEVPEEDLGLNSIESVAADDVAAEALANLDTGTERAIYRYAPMPARDLKPLLDREELISVLRKNDDTASRATQLADLFLSWYGEAAT
eukprot:CAMPEP_0170138428 /NCGR_PEP_ID=MMETSP0033_2-20121228/4913_1 /TAXON_ID=195969 /ORGANISM="Dolichomastix tenuilepis, Strain CCMP3274" /LENGTH=784 /DNA_ID=CAMNT_0010374435 /DNA_START=21 /DNA_END=2375 /DNA_ORIENTATION=+